MDEFLKATVGRQPFTSLTVALYACNIAWQLWHRAYGPAIYWFAAATITITATWLMGWKG